jgi:hypothetical protein
MRFLAAFAGGAAGVTAGAAAFFGADFLPATFGAAGFFAAACFTVAGLAATAFTACFFATALALGAFGAADFDGLGAFAGLTFGAAAVFLRGADFGVGVVRGAIARPFLCDFE